MPEEVSQMKLQYVEKGGITEIEAIVTGRTQEIKFSIFVA